MKINSEKLKQTTGIDVKGVDLYYYIYGILEYLISHNKNYTKEQYFKIQLLYDIFNAIEINEE